MMKGHNSVVNLWRLPCNNPTLDLVKVNAYAKFYFIKMHRYIHKIYSGNKILTITKGHKSVVN